MKLALMLMAGSALVFVGCWDYISIPISNGAHSFDLIEISQMHIDTAVQNLFFPFAFVGFGILLRCFHFIPGCLMDIPPLPLQPLCFWQAYP